MTIQFAACVFTGQEADLDGVCVEHGETACVLSVHAPEPFSACVIAGFQCTHDHDVAAPGAGQAQRS